jgi:hypothetical protein
LAGEEGADEVGVGLGDQAHAVARLGAGGQQALGQIQGLLTQLGVRHGLDQFAAQREQIYARLALGGEIQRRGQGGEISESNRSLGASGCHHYLPPLASFASSAQEGWLSLRTGD